MKKKLLIIGSILFGIVIIVMVSGIIYLMHGQKEMKEVEVNPVILNNLDDGTYIGQFKGYRWTNTIEVSIENHQIIDIKVIKDQVFAQSYVKNQLFDEIKEQQSINVDSVTGATISSIAYLKAIEDALNK